MELDLKTLVLYSKEEFDYLDSEKCRAILLESAEYAPVSHRRIFTLIETAFLEPFTLLKVILEIAIVTIFTVPFDLLSFNKKQTLYGVGIFCLINPLKVAITLLTSPGRVLAAALGILFPRLSFKIWKFIVELETFHLWLKFNFSKKLELNQSKEKTLHHYRVHLAERYLGSEESHRIFQEKISPDFMDQTHNEQMKQELITRFTDYFADLFLNSCDAIDWIAVLKKSLEPRKKTEAYNVKRLDFDFNLEIKPLYEFLVEFKNHPDNINKKIDSELFTQKLREVVKTLNPVKIKSFHLVIKTSWEVMKYTFSQLDDTKKPLFNMCQQVGHFNAIAKTLTLAQMENFENILGPDWKLWNQAFSGLSLNANVNAFKNMAELNLKLEGIISTLTNEQQESFEAKLRPVWLRWKGAFSEFSVATKTEISKKLSEAYAEIENYCFRYGSAKY